MRKPDPSKPHYVICPKCHKRWMRTATPGLKVLCPVCALAQVAEEEAQHGKE